VTNTLTTHTGTIRLLDEDFIQITPYLGFWLSQKQYIYIHQHYKIGDTISITSNIITGFVTEIEEKS